MRVMTMLMMLMMMMMMPLVACSPAAVAVAVIRDGLRPEIHDQASCTARAGEFAADYLSLIQTCWHSDPTIRPTFLEIMTRLSQMNGDSSTAGATSSASSSSSLFSGRDRLARREAGHGSWTRSSHQSSSALSASSSSINTSDSEHAGPTSGFRAPEGEVAVVFTDITRAASLWEFNPSAMRDATLLHNETLRGLLKKHNGYEVIFIRDRNSGEGSFCMVFQQATDAVIWCMEVQQALLKVEWPEALLEHPGAAEEWGDTDDRYANLF